MSEKTVGIKEKRWKSPPQDSKNSGERMETYVFI